MQTLATAVRARYLNAAGPSYLRSLTCQKGVHDVRQAAGWHFTSIGDAAGLAEKMRNSSHQEYAHQDEAYFTKLLGEVRSGRLDGVLGERREIDERFPAYMREHPEAFADHIL